MMDVRDRAEEIGLAIEKGRTNPRGLQRRQIALRPDYTGRNSRLHYLQCLRGSLSGSHQSAQYHLQMRRHEILTQSAGPAEWLPMFNAIENAGAAVGP
jgi:hypothetical protein